MAGSNWQRGLWLAALGLGLASGLDAGQEEIPLLVVVHDEVNAPPEMLQRAERLMSSVFFEIGITVTWMDDAEFARSMPVEPAERRAFVSRVLQLRLISPAAHGAMGLSEGSLGSATASARFAWISFDRVFHSARQANVSPGDALGYVMAHEIGHLLLPIHAHSVEGLMREDFDPILIAHNRLRFLDGEAAHMRAALQQINGMKSDRRR